MEENIFKIQQKEGNHKHVGAPSNLPIMSDVSVEEKSVTEDYKKILDDFIKNPLPISPVWESRLRRNIKERINEGPYQGYLQGLRVSMKALDAEKEKIIAAALALEFDGFDAVKDIPGYNKRLIMSLAIDYNDLENKIGLFANHFVDGKSLKEMVSVFGKNLSNSGYLGKLAGIALKRKDIEVESSQKILNLAKNHIVSETRFNSTWVRFVPDIKGYSKEIIEMSYGQTLSENPNRFDEDFKRLYQFLNDDKELSARHKGDKNRAVSEIFEKSDVLRNAYEAFVPRFESEKKTKMEEEQKNKELQEQKEREQEEVKRKERELQEQKRDEEREAEKKEQLLEDQKRLNDDIKNWLDVMERANVKTNLDADDIVKVGRNGNIEILESENFPVIIMQDFSRSSFQFLASIGQVEKRQGELSRSSYRGHGYQPGAVANNDQLEKLSIAFQKIKDIIKNLHYPDGESIYNRLKTMLGLEEQGASVEEFQGKINKISNVLNEISSVKNKAEEQYASSLGIVFANLSDDKKLLESQLIEMMEQQTEKERQESIIELKKNFLLEQIEKQIDYLRDLYSQESGLLLAEAMGETSSSNGAHIGSVGMGLSQSLRLEQRLELKLEILPKGDFIELEMGDSLESIGKRAAMVNWVAPHEIAHLVDWSKKQKDTKRIMTEKKTLLNDIAKEVKGLNGKTFISAVGQNSGECIIDGIGFKMAREYGTANPFEKQESERISSILSGFCAAMDVLEIIAKDPANQDDKSKTWIAAAIFRMITVGRKIIDEASEKDVDNNSVEKAEKRLVDIKNMFEEMNNELNLISDPETTQKISNLFAESFEAGKNIQL